MPGWQIKNLLKALDARFGRFISAMVLGLNDAVVEMTGALAGFTMALPNNRLIALAGLTTGVAATLSMAASEFLAQRAEQRPGRPMLAAAYTGLTYLVTVALLLLPYFVCASPFLALAICLFNAALIIMLFTWVISRIRKSSFWRGCLEMLGISFSVAAIAFCISWGAHLLWRIEI